jgi:hypothetical protein
MSCTKQLLVSRAANAAGPGHLLAWQRLGAWLGAFGLVICLMGCQPQVKKPTASPPPMPTAAPLPRPVRPTFYVTVNQLRLRACPGKDCPETSTLALNTAVEKLGEIDKWTQIKVRKDATIGYVSSRYLAQQPVTVAKATRRNHRKTKHHEATPPPEPAGAEEAEGGATPQQPEPSPPLPKVM